MTLVLGLVLLVSATDAEARDSIRFTTGVYDSNQQLLNPSFQDYGTAESYSNPIECNGTMSLVHVPLSWLNDPAAEPKPKPEIAMFEVQAAPDQPKSNWGEKKVMKVHAVYLVPMTVSDEQLKSDIERASTKATLKNMCIWDVPIHTKPEAVSIKGYENETVVTQSTKNHSGTWGAAGEIYPKLYADSGKQQLRIKVDVEAGSEIEELAELFMYVSSNKRVMATWKASLKSAIAREQVIQLIDTGLMQDVIVVVRNHAGSVKITRFDMENKPTAGR